MRKIIINGANGFVASNFINELLAQNYKVVALVRNSSKYSATKRMNNALDNITNGRYSGSSNLQVYSYSLLDNNFSMTESQLSNIFSGDVDYYHFAASLKYDLKSKDEIFETNIGGIKNSLKIFTENSTQNSRFFFISTAYSCGNIRGVFKEKFYNPAEISEFRNYYEQSKRFAENIVKNEMTKNNIYAHILRLSQVVGDSKSGVTKTDYGIFDFAKRIHGLAYKYPNQTVRVQVDPDSTQNLIPVNTVVRYLLRTVEVQKLPVIMNFVAKNSIKNIHIINSLCELLPINISPVESIDKKEMNAMERIISVGMSFTGGYIKTNIHFDT
ncbi:MAG: SDR family oxidoreductase, partial [Draconibacterium sp.]|nr:SDR family oxidoreductase [Draconibacterium sp.]